MRFGLTLTQLYPAGYNLRDQVREGVGLGYREDEFATFGFGMNERLGRFLESVAVMRHLWSEDLVQHEGRYYRVVNGRMPLKSPAGHVTPVWFGTENERGIRRAGRV